MHPHQGDNLCVLHGERHVDLYSVEHGKVESFVVTADKIYKNGELITDKPSMLVWPPYVFHRVESKEKGSASLNFAYREKGFDVKDNFSIFDLNIEIKSIESKSNDKSLISTSFLNKTGIKITCWDSMLIELKNNWLLNKHIYED